MPSIIQTARAATARHGLEAHRALTLLRSWYSLPMPRVPGMDTYTRLAIRIHEGRSIEQAAAREYLYRWRLAIKAPDQCIGAGTRNPCVSGFGAPHPIGM